MKYKINIIGAGNVGLAIARRLRENSDFEVNVFNRTPKLDDDFEIQTDLKKINRHANLTIIAVSDGAIGDVAAQIVAKIGNLTHLVVHTAGSVGSSVLKPHFSTVGTLYPLQTFSQNRRVDWSAIPIFLPPQYPHILGVVAERLSSKIYEITDEKRVVLHIGAVFINNFTNLMCHFAEQVVQTEQLPFEVLKPLLNETIAKLETLSPLDAQTGPARRNDKTTLERHKDFLRTTPLDQSDQILKVYDLLSESIILNYTSKNKV